MKMYLKNQVSQLSENKTKNQRFSHFSLRNYLKIPQITFESTNK